MDADDRNEALAALFDLLLFRPAEPLRSGALMKEPMFAEDSLRMVLSDNDTETALDLMLRAVCKLGVPMDEAVARIEQEYGARQRFAVAIRGKDILGRDERAVHDAAMALLGTDPAYACLSPHAVRGGEWGRLTLGDAADGLRADEADLADDLAARAGGRKEVVSMWFVALSDAG